MKELRLSDDEIWGIQFKIMEEFKKRGRLPSTVELDRPVAQAQLDADCKFFEVKCKKCEYDPQAAEFGWFIDHDWTPPLELETKIQEERQKVAREIFKEIDELFSQILRPTLLRAELKYGLDDMARLNIEAGYQSLKAKWEVK